VVATTWRPAIEPPDTTRQTPAPRRVLISYAHDPDDPEHGESVQGLGVRVRVRTQGAAAELDLGDFLDRANGKLSAGQKTRVALAKALINRPELLLLDEPTASLDPDTGDWVRSWLERYRDESGCTILLASHNMLEVERLCDRVIIMKRGKIVDDDTPDGIMARYNRTTLEDVFLDVARGRGHETPSGAASSGVAAS